MSEDSGSEKCRNSSRAHWDEKLEACCVGVFKETCCLFSLGGSKLLFSFSLLQPELKATRIPVARNRWWFAERLPAEWIGSSQSWQKRALSSTQKMKAALSCFIERERESESKGNRDSPYNQNEVLFVYLKSEDCKANTNQ